MYPLKFQPVFQTRLWGGKRLRAMLGRPVGRELEPVGESWELADLPAGTVKGDSRGAAADGSLSSVVANGAWAGRRLREVWEETRNAKRETRNSGNFPLLVKFLDADQDLSVQVHPDGEYCRNHPGAHLKSEAWYVMHAESGAKIYKGVKAGVTKEQFKAALSDGAIAPLLNAIPVRAGDCHYLASGTVHALGAGILAAEVQTPSDTTFRVFDWNRLGADGKARKLHVEEALECIDFASKQVSGAYVGGAARLVTCDYFTMDRVGLKQGESRALGDNLPRVWIVLEGQGVIQCEGHGPTAFVRGDTLLLPGTMKGGIAKAIASVTLLEVRWP